MKVLHTADWHADGSKEFFESLDYLVKTVEEEKPDVVTIAGDLFDRAIMNTENSGFVRLQNAVERILCFSMIAAIEGTPSHDAKGSLETFTKIKSNHLFKILKPGMWYDFDKKELNGDISSVCLSGIPELNKSYFLADSPNASDVEIKELIDKFLLSINVDCYLRKSGIPNWNSSVKILLFHGEIRGAKLNENQLLPQGSLTFSLDDLMSIGADYISCGHIHHRQDLNDKIRYEGSIRPVNWGERSRKGFTITNIIGDKIINQETRFFPHPPMEKLELGDITEATYHVDNIPSCTKLWCNLKITETDYKLMTTKDMAENLDQLISYGYHPDSRITYDVIKPETMRAAEIVEKKSLYDKSLIWAENSLIDFSDPELKAMCEHYEKLVMQSGMIHKSKSLQLISLSLRGSIGIWKGQQKDEIDIDFNDYESGIVALIGDNGRGKSTIIKNCNPYADPIDGGVGLKNMFYLKDSHSNTVWYDEINNVKYKAVKRIKADTKSGKVEYFLYINKTGEWELYNVDQNGRKEPYMLAVLEVFGSPDVFKRSVYIAQKGSSLPTTVGERKALFNELLGNKYIDTIHDMVKSDYNESSQKIEFVDGKYATLKDTVEDENLVLEEKKTVKEQIKESKNSLVVTGISLKKYEDEGKKLAATLKEQQELHNNIELKRSKLDNIIEKRDQASSDLEVTKLLVNELDTLKEYCDKHKQKFDLKESYELQLVELRSQKNRLAASEEAELATLKKESDELHSDLKKVEDQLDTFRIQFSNNTDMMDINKLKIENLADKCHKCGYKKEHTDIDQLYLANEDLKTKNNVIENTDIPDAKNRIVGLNSKIQEWTIKIYNKETFKHPDISQSTNEINDVETKLGAIEINGDEYLEKFAKLSKAKEASEKLVETEVYYAELVASANDLTEQINFDNIACVDLSTLQSDYEECQNNWKTQSNLLNSLTNSITRLETTLGHIDEKIQRITDTKTKVKILKDELKHLQVQQRLLIIMEKATSKNGIQALELDALAPAIITTSNKLLSNVYGTKFTLDLSTVKENSSGNQVEDFEIYVTDNDEVNPLLKTQKLETLSGGEEVWILKSIYAAIAIVREKNTGLKYLTNFQDESDGALSPNNKHLYLKMLEAEHNESGRKHTLVITHDQSVQQIITSKMEI